MFLNAAVLRTGYLGRTGKSVDEIVEIKLIKVGYYENRERRWLGKRLCRR